MTTPILFKEYIWLVNTIYQARKITLININKKWLKTEMSGKTTPTNIIKPANNSQSR